MKQVAYSHRRRTFCSNLIMFQFSDILIILTNYFLKHIFVQNINWSRERLIGYFLAIKYSLLRLCQCIQVYEIVLFGILVEKVAKFVLQLSFTIQTLYSIQLYILNNNLIADQTRQTNSYHMLTKIIFDLQNQTF